jgi:SagB-type dehydrogenase family enzyme
VPETIGEPVQTVNSAAAAYGPAGVGLGDPAELFHEASKLYPSTGARSMAGVDRLEADPALQETSRRAVKRSPQRRALPLPPPRLSPVLLDDAVRSRRSTRMFGPGQLRLDDLAALLFASYGALGAIDGAPGYVRRSAPSGGALYPLEVYAFAVRVEGLVPGLHHYDPLDHALEELDTGPDRRADLTDANLYREAVDSSAAVIAISAMFWRTRFKYGLRGYRFALLEAGHVAQNLLLTAAALGLGAVPVGGFYDARMDALLGLDGLNESTLYLVCVGREEEFPR